MRSAQDAIPEKLSETRNRNASASARFASSVKSDRIAGVSVSATTTRSPVVRVTAVTTHPVRVASSDVIESALAAATGQYGAKLQLPGYLRADCHERRSPQRGCRLEEPVGRGEHNDARSALRRVEMFEMQEERFVE